MAPVQSDPRCSPRWDRRPVAGVVPGWRHHRGQFPGSGQGVEGPGTRQPRRDDPFPSRTGQGLRTRGWRGTPEGTVAPANPHHRSGTRHRGRPGGRSHADGPAHHHRRWHLQRLECCPHTGGVHGRGPRTAEPGGQPHPGIHRRRPGHPDHPRRAGRHPADRLPHFPGCHEHAGPDRGTGRALDVHRV